MLAEQFTREIKDTINSQQKLHSDLVVQTQNLLQIMGLSQVDLDFYYKHQQKNPTLVFNVPYKMFSFDGYIYVEKFDSHFLFVIVLHQCSLYHELRYNGEEYKVYDSSIFDAVITELTK